MAKRSQPENPGPKRRKKNTIKMKDTFKLGEVRPEEIAPPPPKMKPPPQFLLPMAAKNPKGSLRKRHEKIKVGLDFKTLGNILGTTSKAQTFSDYLHDRFGVSPRVLETHPDEEFLENDVGSESRAPYQSAFAPQELAPQQGAPLPPQRALAPQQVGSQHQDFLSDENDSEDAKVQKVLVSSDDNQRSKMPEHSYDKSKIPKQFGDTNFKDGIPAVMFAMIAYKMKFSAANLDKMCRLGANISPSTWKKIKHVALYFAYDKHGYCARYENATYASLKTNIEKAWVQTEIARLHRLDGHTVFSKLFVKYNPNFAAKAQWYKKALADAVVLDAAAA